MLQVRKTEQDTTENPKQKQLQQNTMLQPYYNRTTAYKIILPTNYQPLTPKAKAAARAAASAN